jgi:hypothetical protein
MAKIDRKMDTKAIDPSFVWLPTDVALKLADIRHPNNPLTSAQIETLLKSLPPQKRAEVVVSAQKANTEISKQFLAAAARVK